jgi:cardiolipin synthase A/B
MTEKYAHPRPLRDVSEDMYNHLHPSFFEGDSLDESNDDKFTIVPTANLFFQDVVEQIGDAQLSVDLQFYTLEADEEVSKILHACRDAAERGVDIRILVDHLVSDPRQLRSTLAMRKELNVSSNIEVRRSRVSEGLAGLAIRDHKKIVAIDTGQDNLNGQAYIGGINLARRSLRWNDFMVKMRGPITDSIQADFDSSWEGRNVAVHKVEDATEPGTFLLTDSGKEAGIVQFVLDAAEKAEKRIWLETPYLDMATIGNALMGVKEMSPDLDVRVIVPRFNNYPVDRLRTNKVCAQLQATGIQARQYGRTYRRLNHAKMLLVDDMGVFGSSNFNSSSMAGKNAEIAIATLNPNMVEQLERWYSEDLNESL